MRYKSASVWETVVSTALYKATSVVGTVGNATLYKTAYVWGTVVKTALYKAVSVWGKVFSTVLSFATSFVGTVVKTSLNKVFNIGNVGQWSPVYNFLRLMNCCTYALSIVGYHYKLGLDGRGKCLSSLSDLSYNSIY